MSPRRRERDLALCRRLLSSGPEALPEESAVEETWSELLARLTGKDPSRCEGCGEGSLRWIKELAAEAVCAQAGRSP